MAITDKGYQSCLYECNVVHHRSHPKAYQFKHNVFMFYLDLDELEELDKSLSMFSVNRFNLFSFFDFDHYPKQKHTKTKETIQAFLSEHGVSTPVTSIKLLTNCRIFGYVFNPVSFYFCFDDSDKPVASIVEVSNTFGEMKLFLIDNEHFDVESSSYDAVMKKYFYVSPYTKLDSEFHFKLTIPDAHFRIDINTITSGSNPLPEVLSWIQGTQKPLSSIRLLQYLIGYPFMTIGIMFYIHLHALMLYIKGLKAHEKDWQPELQQHIINPRPR